MKKIILFCIALAAFSCDNETTPKPQAFLALNYPAPRYGNTQLDCPFEFQKNEVAKVEPGKTGNPCWFNLDYDLLNGSIFLTYQPVENNLDSLLRDAQKLPLQHTIKADVIEGDVYANQIHKTYGMLYEVKGNAASQAQFYLTDSTNHFITGSVYFNTSPNYDSILPAASYIRNDMRKIMETLQWKNSH